MSVELSGETRQMVRDIATEHLPDFVAEYQEHGVVEIHHQSLADEYEPVKSAIVDSPLVMKKAFEKVISNETQAKERIETISPKEGEILFTRFEKVHRPHTLDITQKGSAAQIRGVVTKRSQAESVMVEGVFVCDRCKTTRSKTQKGFTPIKEPSECFSCGEEDEFHVDVERSTFERVEWLVVKDIPRPTVDSVSDTSGVSVRVSGSDVGPVRIGETVDVCGRVEPPIKAVSPVTDTEFESGHGYSEGMLEGTAQLDAWSIEESDEPVFEHVDTLSTSKDGELPEYISKLAREGSLIDALTKSVAPSVHGYEVEKAALVLSVVGGVQREQQHDPPIRGKSHIVLESTCDEVSERLFESLSAIETTGLRVTPETDRTLSCTLVEGESSDEWFVEAGPLLTAKGGSVFVEDWERTDEDILQEIERAAVEQRVDAEPFLYRTNIGTLSIVDAEEVEVSEAVPPAFIEDADITIPVRRTSEVASEEILDAIGLTVDRFEQVEGRESAVWSATEPDTPLSVEEVQEIIELARKQHAPELTDDAVERIKHFCMTTEYDDDAVIREQIIAEHVDVTDIGTLARLAEASARVAFREMATVNDAERAIAIFEQLKIIMHHDQMVSKNGRSPEMQAKSKAREHTFIKKPKEGGQQVSDIKLVMTTIENCQEEVGAPVDVVIEEVSENGVEDPQSIIESLKERGEIYEPQSGYLRVT